MSSCSSSLNFQVPCNLEAIRFTILKRVHQQRQDANTLNSTCSSPLPSSSPEKSCSTLDHGLPSPPVEYQKKQPDSMDEDEDDAVSTISSLPPSNSSSCSASSPSSSFSSSSSSSSSSCCSSSWSVEQVELKIKQLKEEKHRLFTQMKDLIQQEEKPTLKPLQTQKPASRADDDDDDDDRLKQLKETCLPSPSPSPTTTPKVMVPPSKFYKSSSRQPYSHSHYQPQTYHRRRSSYHTSATSVLSPNIMSRYFHSASGIPSSTHASTATIASPTSSLTMDNGGRYRYSPYGAYFSHISSPSSPSSSSSSFASPSSTMAPPPGYSTRRTSHYVASSMSSPSSPSIPNHRTNLPSSSSSSSSSSSFRPSRVFVNRRLSRY